VRNDFFATISSFGGEPAADSMCLTQAALYERVSGIARLPFKPIAVRQLLVDKRGA
jgi:hypothetical protein